MGNTLVNGIGGLVFLGSCVVGTPLTQVVARRFRAPDDDAPVADHAARMRRLHIALSAMWGIGLLAEVAARLVVIAHFSVDAANAVNSAITLPVVGLLVVATIVVGRRSAAPAAAAA